MAVLTAQNSAQVIAPGPRSASVMYAPVGTALPTTSYAAVNAGFTDLGYVDEMGIKQKEDRPVTPIFAWGGDEIVDLQEKYSRTISFKLLQFLDENVLAAAYKNSNVTVTPPTSQNGKEIAVALNSQILDVLSWIFDGTYLNALGNTCLVRLVIPRGRIMTNGDVDFTSKALTAADVQGLKAFPDGSQNHGYMYVNDGAVTGGSGLGGS